MSHFWSGLVSWMNAGSGSETRRLAEFEKWARTEYKDDWQFAYEHMVRTNGQRPNLNYKPKLSIRNTKNMEVA